MRNIVEDIRFNDERREKAVKSLYHEYSAQIRNYYISRGLDSNVAEDLLQESFVSVLRDIDSYKGDGQFSAWLWAIVRNHLKMYLRSAKRREEASDPSDFEKIQHHNDTSGMSVNEMIQDCIHQGIESLSKKHEDYAEVIRLIVMYEWTISDISTYLDKKQGATREYLSQARKKLASFIDECRELIMA